MAARFQAAQQSADTGARKTTKASGDNTNRVEVTYPVACRLIIESIDKDDAQTFMLDMIPSLYNSPKELAKYGLEKTNDKRTVVLGATFMTVTGFVKVAKDPKPSLAALQGDLGRFIYAPLLASGTGVARLSHENLAIYIQTDPKGVDRMLSAFLAVK